MGGGGAESLVEGYNPDVITVFGIVAYISSPEGTVIFIGLLLFLIALESGFKYLEDIAAAKGLGKLFEKLKKELMFLGLISFAVFIFNLASRNGNNAANVYFMSFEMSHIIFFSMGLAFIGQSLFLVLFAETSGKRYLNALRTSSETLFELYEDLRRLSSSKTKRAWWWFHEASSFLPTWPAFRFDIEFKIIERLFIFQHRLSPEFNFAHYVNSLFKVIILHLHTPSKYFSFVLKIFHFFLH